MCGICALLLAPAERREAVRLEVTTQSLCLCHRGPDYTGVWTLPDHPQFSSCIAHTRLAIVSPESGSQPIVDSKENIVLGVNGEIYNHQELRREYGWRSITLSDCEVIMHLYSSGLDKKELLNKLRGMFAFVLLDYSDTSDKGEIKTLVARDPFGIIPLYYGEDSNGGFWFASEMKAIPNSVKNIKSFPPGCYMTESDKEPIPYYSFDFDRLLTSSNEPKFSDLSNLFNQLENAVVSHMMCDVPFGVLLSGGLDSSIIAALVCRHAAKRVESGEIEDAWYPRVHSFSVGLEGSPDLANAREMAKYLNTVHHEFIFTVEQAVELLSKVIYHIETYDTTTIRSSTPMIIMAQKIKALGVKMVLSGEGADEIFAGYLYFRKAPTPKDLHEESCRKVKALHLFDCLRANKSMMAHGVECRVPFLDTRFVDYAMSLDPAHKLCDSQMEKMILRKAFGHLLPDSIANRQKEQFSDGVGYQWIDGVKEYARNKYPGDLFEERRKLYPVNTPNTPEELLYRELFHEHFPEERATTVPWGASIACSTPEVMAWDESFRTSADPSGRAMKHHSSHGNQ